MNQLEFSMVWAVLQELFGGFFYPLLIAVALLAVAFLALIAKDHKIVCKRYSWAKKAGFIGGFIALFIIFAISQSGLGDLGGPMDIIVLVLTYIGGFVATGILAYTLLGWFGCKRCQE